MKTLPQSDEEKDLPNKTNFMNYFDIHFNDGAESFSIPFKTKSTDHQTIYNELVKNKLLDADDITFIDNITPISLEEFTLLSTS